LKDSNERLRLALDGAKLGAFSLDIATGHLLRSMDRGEPRRNLRTLRFEISPRYVYFCCEASD
jgi:hypothetical protein